MCLASDLQNLECTAPVLLCLSHLLITAWLLDSHKPIETCCLLKGRIKFLRLDGLASVPTSNLPDLLNDMQTRGMFIPNIAACEPPRILFQCCWVFMQHTPCSGYHLPEMHTWDSEQI